MKKLAVITGASGGIGAEIAKQLSKASHPLLLLGRNIEKLEKLNLPNSICKQVDVKDLNALKSAIAEAEEKYGKVDLMVNNAGIMLLGNAATQDPKEWQEMNNVNVMGVLNGIHAVLQGMVERNEGTIVNVSSIAGRKTFPNHSAYCGTKFAVHAITENIREEVASKNVRLITIAPGAVETELLSHTTDGNIKNGYQEWKDSSMDGKGMDAKHVAQAVEFAYNMPQEVCIREIVIAKTKQQP